MLLRNCLEIRNEFQVDPRSSNKNVQNAMPRASIVI